MKLFDLLFKRKRKETSNKTDEKDVRTDKRETPASAVPDKKSVKDTAPKRTRPTEIKQTNADNKSGQKTKKSASNTASETKPKDRINTAPLQNSPKKSVNGQDTLAITGEADTASSVKKTISSGRFELKKSKDGRFVFNLYASNGNIIATSQVYSSSTSAVNGIKSVIANAERAQIEDQTVKNTVEIPYPKWEIYLDKSRQYRFRLSASNGSCICHSQGYTAKSSCKNGIDSIRRFAKNSEIEKTYIDK